MRKVILHFGKQACKDAVAIELLVEVGYSPNVKSTELKAEEIRLITNINKKIKQVVNHLYV
ncbi:hypothetical protein V4W76_11185 [Bacillus thuringiensis]|uniref:hypothetical protein n=1 Tax=Bacillus cereus group TaxID=86661 RepID=UPI001075FBEB|nr:hypothetical protein [Bacillus cereus]TFZ12073.1 hypothetical protein C6Y54_14945 [Bacillus cereus]HDX9636212.1 hypothetical protein [Bacillus cereus]HEF1898917.1 hypothetical protein [Bacillus cereus]